VGDVLDPPRRRAEREHVADPRLVDHLLVELADPATGPGAAREEDAEQPAVGDRAAAGDGQPLGAGRPVSVPATRSQTSRGRSSANSSDG
jgi:hypothetical protein